MTGDLQSTAQVLGFLMAHIPLVLLMDRGQSTLTTVHAAATLGYGVWMAARGRLERVAMVVSYMVGAEVLWRMTGAQVNWEFGRYAASAIMLLALFRTGRMRPPLLPILYFALLLPSSAITLVNEPFVTARDQLSFNLSGPFALMVCACFFSNVSLSAKDIRLLALAVIGPVLGVATLAASGTFSGSDIVFYNASNMATSGGFGPNQVSGILGFAALLSLFLVLDAGINWLTRVAMGGVLIGCAAQSALTFSRGGLYMAAGGAAVAACVAARDARLRTRLVPLLAVVFIVGNYFVVPYLAAFTDGQIQARFEDTRVTGRDRMIQADIELWKDNPILGVGPGEGRVQRGSFFRTSSGTTVAVASVGIAAHTEFSRLLSEHGVFGLFALILFVIAGVLNVWRAPDSRSQALTAALICWSALFMLSYAMRILAPSLAFGVAFATFIDENPSENKGRPKLHLVRRARGQMRTLVSGHPSQARPVLSHS